MQNPFPRRVRIVALITVFVLFMVWLTPSISTPESFDWAKPSSGSNSAPSNNAPADNAPASHTSPTYTPSKPQKDIIGDKVAVILEDRNLTHLMPLMMHFSAVLGPTWPIVLFTSPNATLSTSAPFQRAVADSRILIKYIPEGTKLKTSHAVSSFLTEPWFWEQLAPSKRVLLFQADSILCANSPTRVDDFLEYDMVGAPIGAFWGEGFNGGLSLRNREMILDILKIANWTTEKELYSQKVKTWKEQLKADGKDVPDGDTMPNTVAVDMEDQWFYQKMKALGGKFPVESVAKTFAVETIDYDWPLGYHQVQRYYGGKADRMAHIDKWCPEHRLCTNDFIYLHPNGDEEPEKKEEEKKEGEKEDEKGGEKEGEKKEGDVKEGEGAEELDSEKVTEEGAAGKETMAANSTAESS
jgi:Protein of unknown function (DUF5672)